MDLVITTVRSRPLQSQALAEGAGTPSEKLMQVILESTTVMEIENEIRKDVVIKSGNDLKELLDEVSELGKKSVINLIPLGAPPFQPGDGRIHLAFFHKRIDEQTCQYSWRAKLAYGEISAGDVDELALAAA